jgi:phage terminase large subunit-like protein
MRLGNKPRQLVTTTPRPIPVIRSLLKGEKTGDVVVTRGSTFDNASNLAPSFIKGIREKYEGTRLGRQELYAEVLDDVPGALFTRKTFERRSEYNTTGAGMAPDEVVPDMARVVVAVDPSGASGKKDDESHDDIGVSVCGKGVDGNYYVLEDATCQLGPAGWARRAVEKYREHLADVLVGETNYGGAMVEFTIRAYDSEVPYKAVTASRGKVVRAEPIALLYEQGRVRHAGPGLSPLEDELKDFSRSGYMGAKSPNRADAMVWAMTELMTGDPDYDPNMLAKLLD